MCWVSLMEVRDGMRIIDKIRVDSGFEEGRKRGGVWLRVGFPGAGAGGGQPCFHKPSNPSRTTHIKHNL